jgi:DNA-binding NarL/FixJ family response regulator
MATEAPIRVLLADDHALVRAGIAALLRGIPGIEVAGEAGDGAEAIAFARRLQPDIVLLDIAMKGMGGLEAMGQVAAACPGAKVIILSMHTGEEYVQHALRAGAKGYLVKDSATAELDLAVRCVMRGETYLSPAVSRHLIKGYVRGSGEASADPALTPRQREVLKLLAEGKSTKEIAQLLCLSVKTVETFRAQIQERLGIRDLAGLIRYAMRTGLVPPEQRLP